jgi:hypothetical protein
MVVVCGFWFFCGVQVNVGCDHGYGAMIRRKRFNAPK